MDDAQRIVKCGHLSLHSAGGFFKKRWHNKYLVLYDGSKSGVKRLELFDSEIKFKKQNPERIIPLVDCVRVVTCQRQKSTYTFEVRTSDQFYLLAAQSFQAMNDWVNCLRLVAFGQQQQQASSGPTATQTASGHLSQLTTGPNSSISAESASVNKPNLSQTVEQTKLGERRQLLHAHTATDQSGATSAGGPQPAGAGLTTASQAAAAAASALAKTRQRQPSLLGSCKPQPPGDSPFISGLSVATPTRGSNAGALATSSSSSSLLNCSSTFGQLDTMTPTVRGQLISTKNGLIAAAAASPQLAATTPPPKGGHNQMVVVKPSDSCNQAAALVDQIGQQQVNSKFNQSHRQQPPAGAATMQILNEEEEENMLYCSIEDNPSEHNYRVKVIETELALRCQLKCYQLIEPTLISEQYEELAQFRHQNTSSKLSIAANNKQQQQPSHCIVTFYQLIIGPQELTLLNDYATSGSRQQGLWSWPYQCIRRYGFDKDNCFMFEAGRKCTSGPGQFIVQTPKAYSIYQDIVKFVNELRTINGTQATNPALSFGQQKQPLIDIDNHQAPVQQKQLVVTQIPVVWAPNKHLQQQQVVATGSGQQTVMCQDELPAGDGEHRKRQFFDALRQSMDSSASCLGANITTTTTSGTGANNEADNLQVQVQVASSDGLDNLQAININGAIKQQQAATETSATATKVLDTTSNRPPGHELAVAGRRSLANSSSTATTTTATNISGTQDNGSADVASNPMIHESKSSLLGAAKLVQAQRLRKLDDNHNNNTQAPDSIKKQSILLGPLTAVGASQASSKILAASKSTAIGHNNISSSDHDTDESGYEQGDESVDSCSTSLVKTKKAPSSPTSSSTSEPIVVVGRKRQLASDSMSSASSTSSEAMQTSPIQSVSRRTTGGLGPISTAAATTTTTVGGPGSRFSSAPSTNVGQGPAKRPPISNSIRSVATIASNIEKRQQQSKQHLFNGLRTSHTATAGGDGGGLLDDGRQRPFDFEANLIRDVYSEISKLHAKFAVTSSGSADDSMSSGSSRESASSDQIDQGADETDDRRLDGNDDNEPMYSNLESRVSGIDDLRRRVMNSNRREREQENDELIGDSKGASRTASSRLNASRQQSINHKAQQQATQNGIQQQAQRSQTHQHNNNNHPHHHNHSQQQQHHHQSNLSQVNTNNLGRIGGNLLDMSYLSQSSIAPPLSSSSMRQLYPTILNPIPECGELAHQPPPVAPKPSKGSLNDIPSSPNTSSRTTNELRLGGVARSQQATSRTSQPPEFGAVIEKGLPRAQLVPSRNLANITNNNGTNQLQQSSSKNRQTTNKLKPTNHYVINDVQYAKISRNLRY